MKKKVSILLAALSMALALGILLYPAASSAYNSSHQSQICVHHQEQAEKMPDEQIQKMKQKAKDYNSRLKPIDELQYTADTVGSLSEEYGEQLNMAGDGIMGYLEIPKIKVKLPIYHGTNDATLELGIGHLMGSALPVGGAGTHCILTAHSGMASQKMFSDLPQLKEGDTFYLHVLDEVLAYQVDAIHVVLPEDTSYLGAERGQDHCTLVTCTPFGVNTHRLLVRGSRVPFTEASEPEADGQEQEKTAGSTWEQEYLKGILYGIGILLLILAVCFGIRLWRTHHEKA